MEIYAWFVFLLSYGVVCIVHFNVLWILKSLLLIIYFIYIVYLGYRQNLFGNYQAYVSCAQLVDGGAWILTKHSGYIDEYKLLGESFLSKRWVILRFKPNHAKLWYKKKTMILSKNTQPQSTWRALQIYLRYINKRKLV